MKYNIKGTPKLNYYIVFDASKVSDMDVRTAPTYPKNMN